ncbi:hypothetical protein M899_0689 [Bacteriovorax sp. BSW11_IV]|uniref:hypothetical protein n=1 Tax=Bacteriovorax sp. BSW11_IV TaxID=1353529 RepID=UPI00038A165D|nr:hypothetical protein [Bacteriovorax sp. BSW11_IV]EQC49250.1 hypothetical protein M899_0689 [Bacteriovorax sp. BSW11_IV]
MKLLTLAHRAEAHTFFKELKLSAVAEVDGLYQDDNIFLLITGEGKEEALAQVSFVLGRFPEITDVFNTGLCGALDPNQEIGSTHFIRTIYCENDGEMIFKSYTTVDKGLDIITSNKRVLEKEYADHLECFAPLVDRELWAIAHACKLFHKPLRSVKLVSDHANGNEICKMVRDKQEEYAEYLFDKMMPLLSDSLVQKIESPENDIFSKAHFSLSMQRKYNSTLHSLELKYNFTEQDVFNEIKVNEILEENWAPKRKALAILEKMNALLSPYKIKLEEKTKIFLSPLSKYDIVARPDKDFDNVKLQFTFTATSSEELELKLHALKKIDYNQYKSIIFGEDDVF